MTLRADAAASTADGTAAAFDRAAALARGWLGRLPDRRVPASGSVDDAVARLGTALPEGQEDPVAVVERLAAAVEPGLMASGSGRFYGWVMGGSFPAALGADVLVTAWDQNAGMRDATPGVVAVEEVAAAWVLDLLGLPVGSGVGFTTGATMANFTCIAAARHRVLQDVGVDDRLVGLADAPRIRVLAGAERHGSIDLALRLVGLGAAELVPSDAQGRVDAVALREALAGSHRPTIVCLQAGNLHSGAFDPFGPAVAAAREAGAWVHVDGAFGLWALATPTLDALTAGLDGADSWATDAHKTLNTPYDGGIAIVRDPATLEAAMGQHATYLLTGARPDPHLHVPEMSRRARGVPVWAAIASLGRSGVRGLVDGLHDAASAIAEGALRIPGATVLNDVVYTQVSVAFETDERTRAVLAELLRDGTVMPSGSVWSGRAVIRFSVSSWRTGDAEVRATLEALRRAVDAVPA
ncbi:pyridoxal phosphate-dependent decarboxylase family protein [uncultured Amnibacterium sp.]|uniref:pyridoxal phosphate-dependent decarboxylase family protein n=1 Tax=uncultured Amnibacterium sp. TaxID=1631851 RepID=UPI0035CA93B8